MKRILPVLPLLALLVAPIAPLHAADEDTVGTVESDSNAVERFLYSVWSGIQALNPRRGAATDDDRAVATAGLRGADGSADGMGPYWKGDLADDPAFRERFAAYEAAIEHGRDGDPAPLEAWLDEHGDSDLAANARLALAAAYAGAGRRNAARDSVDTFLARYPKHPLAPKARALKKRL